MALNINIEKRIEEVTYFDDIHRGEFFLFNDRVFVKLEELFLADDLITELEYQHDFQHECDIDSNKYNCWLVGSECGYHRFENTTIVEKIDVEMNVRYVK